MDNLISHKIEVRNILQYPELPTGCECVSLTILLNHLGFPADKMQMARKYLPKLDFSEKDGVLYGADFRTTFAGDPESGHAYGCYAPCIVETAKNYLQSVGSTAQPVDLTGSSFEDLLRDYIDRDVPVLIWVTSSDLHETKRTTVWTTPSGEQVQWIAYEHCVVLTGYNRVKGIVFASDPLVGNTVYDYALCKQRYEDLGRQAVMIEC